MKKIIPVLLLLPFLAGCKANSEPAAANDGSNDPVAPVEPVKPENPSVDEIIKMDAVELLSTDFDKFEESWESISEISFYSMTEMHAEGSTMHYEEKHSFTHYQDDAYLQSNEINSYNSLDVRPQYWFLDYKDESTRLEFSSANRKQRLSKYVSKYGARAVTPAEYVDWDFWEVDPDYQGFFVQAFFEALNGFENEGFIEASSGPSYYVSESGELYCLLVGSTHQNNTTYDSRDYVDESHVFTVMDLNTLADPKIISVDQYYELFSTWNRLDDEILSEMELQWTEDRVVTAKYGEIAAINTSALENEFKNYAYVDSPSYNLAQYSLKDGTGDQEGQRLPDSLISETSYWISWMDQYNSDTVTLPSYSLVKNNGYTLVVSVKVYTIIYNAVTGLYETEMNEYFGALDFTVNEGYNFNLTVADSGLYEYLGDSTSVRFTFSVSFDLSTHEFTFTSNMEPTL